MRNRLLVLCTLLLLGAPAMAQVSVGINLSFYPDLVPIQGYPVYYAPGLNSNYFFYDGMYWIYQGDDWYASSWYNGPWMLVAPEAVPLFILRVPVRYYRHPPAYFRGWRSNAPPRWDEHWGGDWAQRRRGWDQWNRNSAPARAPLPTYQRQYTGNRYPQAQQQQVLQERKYRYQPRDPEVRQHYQAQAVQSAPAPARRETRMAPQERAAPPQRRAAEQEQRQRRQQDAVQYQQQEPQSRSREGSQGRARPQDSAHGQRAGQGDDRERMGGGQEQGGAGQEHRR